MRARGLERRRSNSGDMGTEIKRTYASACNVFSREGRKIWKMNGKST